MNWYQSVRERGDYAAYCLLGLLVRPSIVTSVTRRDVLWLSNCAGNDQRFFRAAGSSMRPIVSARGAVNQILRSRPMAIASG